MPSPNPMRMQCSKTSAHAGAVGAQAFQAAGRAGEAVGQPVRGGLWEADLAARRMVCVYWPEPAHRVARGTWFLEKGVDWVPLQVGPRGARGGDAPAPRLGVRSWCDEQAAIHPSMCTGLLAAGCACALQDCFLIAWDFPMRVISVQ